jgi:hypothetical protein
MWMVSTSISILEGSRLATLIQQASHRRALLSKMIGESALGDPKTKLLASNVVRRSAIQSGSPARTIARADSSYHRGTIVSMLH